MPRKKKIRASAMVAMLEDTKWTNCASDADQRSLNELHSPRHCRERCSDDRFSPRRLSFFSALLSLAAIDPSFREALSPLSTESLGLVGEPRSLVGECGDSFHSA